VRTAARSGADIRFDWDDPATFEPALRGTTGVYLVSPVLRTDFADVVSRFLDQSEHAGVRSVTYLSAYGVEHAPADVALRAVELDLMSRSSLTWSIIRPAWFMQDSRRDRLATGQLRRFRRPNRPGMEVRRRS